MSFVTTALTQIATSGIADRIFRTKGGPMDTYRGDYTQLDPAPPQILASSDNPVSIEGGSYTPDSGGRVMGTLPDIIDYGEKPGILPGKKPVNTSPPYSIGLPRLGPAIEPGGTIIEDPPFQYFPPPGMPTPTDTNPVTPPTTGTPGPPAPTVPGSGGDKIADIFTGLFGQGIATSPPVNVGGGEVLLYPVNYQTQSAASERKPGMSKNVKLLAIVAVLAVAGFLAYKHFKKKRG
jgi:hypothetical protein